MSGYALWNPSTTYILDNLVFFDGVIYICIQAPNINHQPNSSPTWWASNGGGGTITSIVGGAGISVSGSTSVLITNTGVRTLASGGTGISIGGTTTDRTVSNTGVLTLTAGTNVSLTGTAQNPTINLVPSPLPAGVSLNINNADFVVPVAQLANCYLYSSTALTAPRTISFPNYATLLAQYGANAVIPFFWGNMRQPSPVEATILAVVGDNTPSNVYFNESTTSAGWVVSAPLPSSATFVLLGGNAWRGTCFLDSTLGNAYYTFTWLTPFT